jgi:hypothetical protein
LRRAVALLERGGAIGQRDAIRREGEPCGEEASRRDRLDERGWQGAEVARTLKRFVTDVEGLVPAPPEVAEEGSDLGRLWCAEQMGRERRDLEGFDAAEVWVRRVAQPTHEVIARQADGIREQGTTLGQIPVQEREELPRLKLLEPVGLVETALSAVRDPEERVELEAKSACLLLMFELRARQGQ